MAWLLPAATVLLALMPVNDLAYQIRAGRWMLDARELLRRDVFTYTVGGQPWLNQQWGAEVLLGWLYGAVGWRGLVVVRAILVTGAAGVTFRRARAAGSDPIVAGCLVLVCLLTAFALPGTAALRSQLLAVPLFLCSLWLLAGRHERASRLLWLVPVGIVWANVHGSFLLLTALLVIACVADLSARRPRELAWTSALTLVSVVTPLVTPWGTGTYRYVADVVSSPVIRHVIEEWKPLWGRTPAGPLFLVVVMALAVLVVLKRSRGPTLEETLTLALFTGLAVWSGRNLLWWALVTPPIVGALLAGWHPERGAPGRSGLVIGGALVALVAIGLVRVVAVQPAQALLSEAASPGLTAAVRAASGESGRVFDGWWGSWFELALPDVRMFIDARSEMIPDEVWDDYFRATAADPGWEEVLNRWRVGVVVAAKEQHPALIEALARDPAWTSYYEDTEGVVFVRRPSS
jgi:hypothetical protein